MKSVLLKVAAVLLTAAVVGSAWAQSKTCTDEHGACLTRCDGVHGFKGKELESCRDIACASGWGMCMKRGYWVITRTKQKIGPLEKK
jgi:hypothetical protein